VESAVLINDAQNRCQGLADSSDSIQQDGVQGQVLAVASDGIVVKTVWKMAGYPRLE